MKHVLAIDEGTTGVTCLMVSEEGRIVGGGYRELTQYFPNPGWVEHDASEIFERALLAAREALAESGVVPDAIGITNQRETVVIWDRETGIPLAHAIVWQDRRTAERCRELAPQAADITARTGLPVDPYFSATKLEDMLTRPEIAARVAAGGALAGTMDTWLIWKLTNGAVHATDPTNASRTMLFDIGKRTWSDELCKLFGVPRSILPEVRPSSGDFGEAAAEHLGIRIPIRGVAGDQQAALFGQGCYSAGEGKNTYGTGAFLLLNTGDVRPQPGEGILVTVACDASGGYAFALEGSIFIAGAAVQWLRDGLRIIEKAGETEELAKSLASNDGVYFVPALTGLGAPHWEPEARGTIVGLTRGTTRAHLARAALEAMAYGTNDVLAAMRERSGVPFDRLRVDGGASVNNWLMQFQADVIGVPVERPEAVETTALGAAGLAGIASGVWKDSQEFLSVRRYTTFNPGVGASERAGLIAGWDRAISTTLHWAQARAKETVTTSE
ncbi:MAG TPA: glycerol kinase GlpK [Gemmatimonadaceae bacterium]|nr:glycerol kinase GlpK [Gemmatimonadaceae bacterium]